MIQFFSSQATHIQLFQPVSTCFLLLTLIDNINPTCKHFSCYSICRSNIQFCHSLPHVESSEFIDRPRIEAPHLGLEAVLGKTDYPWLDSRFFEYTRESTLHYGGEKWSQKPILATPKWCSHPRTCVLFLKPP